MKLSGLLDKYNRAKRETCKHEHKKDFSCWSFGDERRIEHFYCPDCKGHWYDGKFYNQREWDRWINAEDDEICPYCGNPFNDRYAKHTTCGLG